MNSVEWKKLKEEEITPSLFEVFERYQNVTKCYRKIEGEWRIKDIAFVEEWSEEDYEVLVRCLKNTVKTNGVVFGTFVEGYLKGFASVEGNPIGSQKEYYDLSSIHVSADQRGNGLGKELFRHCVDWARKQGAKKLYISAHSAVESQAFYKAMGCVEAVEYQKEHVEKEPCDCQLELVL